MEWGLESAAVRRHRVGAERRDGRAATSPWEREAPAAQEPVVDVCSGGARTRKRSAAGSGGASRAAGTGLSEARAALGLALYLLVLRTLVQLSLQQLVLRGAAGHHGEFDARQARYWLLPLGPRIPVGHLAEPGHCTCVHPPLRDRSGSLVPLHVEWGGRVSLLEVQFTGRGARMARC